MAAVGFHRYETEPLMLVIERDGVDRPLEGYARIAVSFDQRSTEGSCHIDYLYEPGAPEVDVAASAINLHFTQEEAAQFVAARANVEVNILYEGGERAATCEGVVNVWRNLYDEVMQ